MSYWALLLIEIFIIGAGLAADVPFVFSDNLTSIADHSSDELEEMSASSNELNGIPKDSSLDRWDHQDEFDAKIEPDNIIIRQEVSKIEGIYSGGPDIANVCSIFEYFRYGDSTTSGWRYINDPRGLNWAYANESIRIGKNIGNTGAGDCDDFAIVMSSLVESIGGTSRIVLGINSDISHAFSEVYLGQDNGQDSKVENIIKWLMDEFGTDKIHTHVDTDTKDVWLNLDWWANHPGGRFYKADEYVVYLNRNQYQKTSLIVSSYSRRALEQVIDTPIGGEIDFDTLNRTRSSWKGTWHRGEELTKVFVNIDERECYRFDLISGRWRRVFLDDDYG